MMPFWRARQPANSTLGKVSRRLREGCSPTRKRRRGLTSSSRNGCGSIACSARRAERRVYPLFNERLAEAMAGGGKALHRRHRLERSRFQGGIQRQLYLYQFRPGGGLRHGTPRARMGSCRVPSGFGKGRDPRSGAVSDLDEQAGRYRSDRPRDSSCASSSCARKCRIRPREWIRIFLLSMRAKPLTNRGRLATHANAPMCAGCHNLIDPIGFGFEKFDAIGMRREQYKLVFGSDGSPRSRTEGSAARPGHVRVGNRHRQIGVHEPARTR